MLQRILGAVLVLLGLGGAALGVASATVWREAETVVATARPAGDGTLVVTDPGVLGLVNSDVTITATAPDDQAITLAVGREADVLGWVGDDAYSRVTGLTDWETLGVTPVAAATPEEGEGESADGEEAEEPTAAPDPAGSDMWVAEASDTGSVTLRWSDTPGRWVLLAAGVGEGAQAPTLELTWPRAVTTPYLWPGVGAGALLIVVGLLVLLAARRRSRADEPAAPAGRRKGRRADGSAASPSTGPEPESSGDSPSTPFTWRPAVAPDRAEDDRAAAPGPFAPVNAPVGADGGEPDDERSGTAPVPVAGRFSRRSRQARDLPVRNPGEQTPPVVDTGSFGATPASTPFSPVSGDTATSVSSPPFGGGGAPGQPTGVEPDQPAVPAASGGVRLTRRELRMQEEARRAAEQGGVGRRLRSLTGSIPAVRPPSSQTSTPQPAEPEPPTRAGRAAAWRQAWGFEPTTTQDDSARHTDSNDQGDR